VRVVWNKSNWSTEWPIDSYSSAEFVGA